MTPHEQFTGHELFHALRKEAFPWAGNRKLKIYGRLGCGSGKRMKSENRVFFENEEEALRLGYRRCKVCLRLM